MLAVVKKPHTNQTLFEIKGEIPANVLRYLEQIYGQNIVVFNNEEEVVNLFETDWYQDIRQQISSGDILRIYRENLGMTQAELAQKMGEFDAQTISDMENNKFHINNKIAKQLSRILGAPKERFLLGV